MMDEQGEHQEGWQSHDLTSGVAKVFAEAKARNALGYQVGVGWSIALAVHALLGFFGLVQTTPPLWDGAASLGAGVLASIAMSRTPAPMLATAAVVIADQVALAFQFGVLIEQGNVADHLASAVRILAAPVVLFFLLNGWMAAISIQAFKNGFSPGADWRTRINPRTMSIVIILTCFVALVIGVLVWIGAIRAGLWVEAEEQEDKRSIASMIGEKVIEELPDHNPLEKPPVPAVIPYPDSARPVSNLNGLDEYARGEAEDAWWFAEESDDNGCVLEGQGRQDRCRDDRCKYWARFFVRACLAKAKKTPKFCAVVPKPTDGTGGEEWATKLCAGRTMETCRELLFAVQGHCHPPEATDVAPLVNEAAPRRDAR